MAPHRLGSASVVKYSRMVEEGVVRGVQIRLFAVSATGLHMWLPWAGLSLVGSLCLSLQTLEHLKLDSYGTPPPPPCSLTPVSRILSHVTFHKAEESSSHPLFPLAPGYKTSRALAA